MLVSHDNFRGFRLSNRILGCMKSVEPYKVHIFTYLIIRVIISKSYETIIHVCINLYIYYDIISSWFSRTDKVSVIWRVLVIVNGKIPHKNHDHNHPLTMNDGNCVLIESTTHCKFHNFKFESPCLGLGFDQAVTEPLMGFIYPLDRRHLFWILFKLHLE